jgi:ABC-type branched-subunit amino acid transport system ATPase component
MLETRALEKSFAQLKVMNGVSMKVEKGERRVVLGPNGAGKTTLFNMLAGELRPTAGRILLDGADITEKPVEARAHLGLARSYQRNNLFNELTVRENLTLAVATTTGASGWLLRDTLADQDIKVAVADVAEQVALAAHMDQCVDSISYGSRRQLEVGIALATRPRVLLLDEPTSGIGPEMIHAFHRLLKSLPADLTLVIIEHDMDLALDIADHVTVLNYGEVVFDGTPEGARASSLVQDIYLGSWSEHA